MSCWNTTSPFIFFSPLPYRQGKQWVAAALLFFGAILLFPPVTLATSSGNELHRVQVTAKKGYTRLRVYLSGKPEYHLTPLSGNRLQLTLNDTGGMPVKKIRHYSDINISGIGVSRREDHLVVTMRMATGSSWRDVSVAGIDCITVDVGKTVGTTEQSPYIPGREKIWNGVASLIRDFKPPQGTDIPFIPTDLKILNEVLDQNEVKVFQAAEATLYKGRSAEAESLFLPFTAAGHRARTLALYRLGEARYQLQNYPLALQSFREAEKLWPEYLEFDPMSAFSYGDSIARSGNVEEGRRRLSLLIARLADKKFTPSLLVLLADILTSAGETGNGLAIYHTVASHFAENKAGYMARLRLADKELAHVTPWNYLPLVDEYGDIAQHAPVAELREEAQFKQTLLYALNGKAVQALQSLMAFQARFPKGVYGAVSKGIREVLVGEVYRETDWQDDSPGFRRFCEEHKQYLAECVALPFFLEHVAKAFDASGHPVESITFMTELLEFSWAANLRLVGYEMVADRAESIGDTAKAEQMLKNTLSSSPLPPQRQRVLEKLAKNQFVRERYAEVLQSLSWLQQPKAIPRFPESLFYLGRASAHLNDHERARKILGRYLAVARADSSVPVSRMTDAYLTAAIAEATRGNRAQGLNLLRQALALPKLTRRDELLFKAAEYYTLEGKAEEAKKCYLEIIEKSTDSDWKKLAQQALVTH